MTPHTDAATTLAANEQRLQGIRKRAEWRKQLIDPVGLRRVDRSDEDFLLDTVAALERQLADAQARERAAVYVTLTPEAQARYAYDKDEELLIVASWIEGNYYYTVEGRSGRNIATSSDLRLAVYCPQPQENSHE